MPQHRERLAELIAELRRRRPALRKAWGTGVLDRVATELARHYDFDEALVRALMREELGDQMGETRPADGGSPTRTELPADQSDTDD